MKRLIIACWLMVSLRAFGATDTPFYINQAIGSNLNSGSKTNAAATVTYTSGTWVSATGIYTVPAGNPAADGVNLGDWASIYVDGATVGVFVARITATNATTITVDITAKSGTAPTDGVLTRSMKVGGCWKGPNSAENFPFNFVQNTMTNLNSGIAQGLPPHVYIQGTCTITAAITHANAGPIIWEGYTTTPGDGGRATITDSTTAASYILFTASCANNNFANLIFSTTFSSGSSEGVLVSGAENVVVNVVIHDVRGYGLNLTAITSVIECEIYLSNKSNTSSRGAFSVGTSCILDRCIAHDNAGSNTSGFLCNGISVLKKCIADTNGKDGATVSSTTGMFISDCEFYNNTAAGIDVTAGSASPLVVQNSNFVKNGTWGINSTGSPIRNGSIINCGFGSGSQTNGVGTVNTVQMGAVQEFGSVTYSANSLPWVDAPNGDFRINLTAAKGTGRGNFTETQASYTGTIGYPDIGAAQHLDSGSSTNIIGGSSVFVQ